MAATRLTRLLRQDVVAMADGRNLGRPHTVLIDPSQHRVAALVLVPGRIPELSVCVRASSVHSFDSDTIAIEALTSLRVAAHDEMALELLGGRVRFRNRPVLSSQGARLGRIKDAVVDDSGQVTEYWIKRHRLGSFRRCLKVRPDDLTAPAGQVAVVDHRSRIEPEAPVLAAVAEAPAAIPSG